MSNQIKKLYAQLRKEQKEVEKKIENLVQEAAFNGNKYAKQKAPVEFGKLRQSIGVQKKTSKNYEVVASMPYAPFVEFGTGVNVNVDDEWKDVAILFKGEKAIIGQRPQPFMIPAYNKTTAELTEKLKKYVR